MTNSTDKECVSVRLEVLTCREQQVAALVCRGYTNKLIAQELNLTEGTIKVHLHSVFQKLNVSNRGALIVKLSEQ